MAGSILLRGAWDMGQTPGFTFLAHDIPAEPTTIAGAVLLGTAWLCRNNGERKGPPSISHLSNAPGTTRRSDSIAAGNVPCGLRRSATGSDDVHDRPGTGARRGYAGNHAADVGRIIGVYVQAGSAGRPH